MSDPKVAAAVRAPWTNGAKLFCIANKSLCLALVVDMLFSPSGLALALEHAAQHRLLFYLVAGKVTINLRLLRLAATAL